MQRGKTPITLLHYIHSFDTDKSLDFYSKVSKQRPDLEIVLHPDPTEEVTAENQSLLESLRAEGYYESQNMHKSSKPEKLKINYKYTDVELSAREVKIRDLNQFKNYRCQAGREHLWVSATGQVMASSCGQLPALADQLGDSFVVPAEGYVCPAAHCYKNDDILISKLEPKP